MSEHKILEKPIIFIGSPRSGTSVISEIVMRHYQIGFPSQYQDKFKSITFVNVLRRLFDNNIWRFHGQKKQLNAVTFFNRYIFRPVEGYAMWASLLGNEVDFGKSFLVNESLSQIKIQQIRQYFKDILKMQGKSRLSFKTTGPSRIRFLKAIFPDAQFIHIHRNPVPNVNSLLNVEFWKSSGLNKLWWTGCYSLDELQEVEKILNDPVALTSYQLKKIHEVTRNEIEQFSPDLLSVKYEEFILNPEGTIANILEFTGLPEDQACADYFIQNTIYDQNKADEEYFCLEDLEKIRSIFKV